MKPSTAERIGRAVITLHLRPRGRKLLYALLDSRPMSFHERAFVRGMCWRFSEERTQCKLENRRLSIELEEMEAERNATLWGVAFENNEVLRERDQWKERCRKLVDPEYGRWREALNEARAALDA